MSKLGSKEYSLKDALRGVLAQFDDLDKNEYNKLSKEEYGRLEEAINCIDALFKRLIK